MIEQLWDYFISLYKEVPSSVYEGLIALLCIGSVSTFCKWGVRRGWSKVGFLFLVEYVFLLFGSTVIFRSASDAISGHNFYPFWSYRAIVSGESPQLLPENIMNVVVFVPVGILLGILVYGSRLIVFCYAKRQGRAKKEWLIPLAVGLCISLSIEMLQFFLNRGFSELDDVIHNTLGCLIGYGVYKLICSILL